MFIKIIHAATLSASMDMAELTALTQGGIWISKTCSLISPISKRVRWAIRHHNDEGRHIRGDLFSVVRHALPEHAINSPGQRVSSRRHLTPPPSPPCAALRSYECFRSALSPARSSGKSR